MQQAKRLLYPLFRVNTWGFILIDPFNFKVKGVVFLTNTDEQLFIVSTKGFQIEAGTPYFE